MNEKEFKKLNEQLQQQQRKSVKERQSAAKISESYKILLNETEEKRRNPACGRCGKTDTDLVVTEGKYGLLCGECEEARRKWVELEAKRQVRERRKLREMRTEHLRARIDMIIPKMYRKARLRHLGERFKETLLHYNPAMGLVLFGPVGTGKTYSLCALLRSLIASGLVCRRIGYEMLCLRIRDSFKTGSGVSELDVVKEYVEADVLLLEDLGCSKPIGSAESNSCAFRKSARLMTMVML